METTEEMKQRRFTWKLDKLQLRVSYSQWPQSRSPLPNFVFLILICLKEDPQNYVCSGLTNVFPGGAVVNNMPANAGDLRDTGSILGSGRSPGEGHGNPLQYSCLENPMDRRAWWAIDGVTKSWTQLKRLSMHAKTWWYIHSLGYYLEIKRSDLLIYTTT